METVTIEDCLLAVVAQMDGTNGFEIGLIDHTDLGLGWYWEVINDEAGIDEAGMARTITEAMAEIFEVVCPD